MVHTAILVCCLGLVRKHQINLSCSSGGIWQLPKFGFSSMVLLVIDERGGEVRQGEEHFRNA